MTETNTSRENKVKVGDIVGGFSVPSPWDSEVPVYIKKAVVRDFDGELWAEHLEPQYDYTEIDDAKYWIKYLIK